MANVLFTVAYTTIERALYGCKSKTIRASVNAFCTETLLIAKANPAPSIFSRTWRTLNGISGCSKYPDYVQEVIGLGYDKKTKQFSGKMKGINWDNVISFEDWKKSKREEVTDFDKLMKIIKGDNFSLTKEELAQVLTALNG